MDPTNKGPGKFYELFKVHKQHEVGKPPPERPIVSTCGSFTENIGTYIQNTLKKYSNIHDSFLELLKNSMKMEWLQMMTSLLQLM